MAGDAEPTAEGDAVERPRPWCGECAPARGERGLVCSSTCSTEWPEHGGATDGVEQNIEQDTVPSLEQLPRQLHQTKRARSQAG